MVALSRCMYAAVAAASLTRANADVDAACSANAGCTHLSGNCCPADDGMQLVCCNEAPSTTPPAPTPEPGPSSVEQAACATDITASIAAITSAAKFINYAVEDCPFTNSTVANVKTVAQRKCADDITSAITDFAVASKTISAAVQHCGGPGTACAVDISNSVASISASSETLIEAALHCDKSLLSYDVFHCVVDVFDVIDTLTHASKSIYDAVDSCEPAPTPTEGCDKVTAGQVQVIVNGCEGAGCNANGDNQDCAWCVIDMSACKTAYGDTCEATKEARDAQNVECV